MLGIADARIILDGVVQELIEKGIAKEFKPESNTAKFLQDRIPVDDEMPDEQPSDIH